MLQLIFCFLVTLITLNVSSVQALLSPTGEHVETTYEYYYVTEQYNTKKISYYTTCTRHGFLWLSKRCRSVSQYRWIAKYRTVQKSREIYVCENGYKEIGDNCLPDCGTYGCRHGGTCVSPGSCSCPQGWKGAKCETDVNECRYSYEHRCAHECKNTQGSFYCRCPTGYRLSSDSRTCADIDECRDSYPNPCGSGSTCTNTIGSFRCRCNPGFSSSSGKYCKDIDECKTHHGCQGVCHNTYGSYECKCPDGLSLHDERSCKDVDECQSNGCEYKCVNFYGSYKCICQKGYEPDSRRPKSCTDTDECSKGMSGCSQECINTIGSFTCSCRNGYVLAWDKRTCDDVNECNKNNSACVQYCVNTIGSYHCSCRPGFDLNPDKKTCQGRACRPIHVPFGARKHCDGHTTDSFCSFTCILGYEIKTGPTFRTCLASKEWSGKEPICSPVECVFPKAPLDGFVYDPCHTTYQSECQLGCEDGFFENGNFTIKCSALKKWEPENIACIKSAVCDNKPCLKNGVCISVGVDKFTCDCSSTGYNGKRCEIGEILPPDYEVMRTGQMTSQLEFLASTPNKEVIVTPLSEGVTFDPPSLIFIPENGKLKVKRYIRITALNQSGIFQVRYAISGENSEDYYPVQPDLIVIYSSTKQSNDIDLKKIYGCHQIILYKCPGENNYITAGSTSPWATYDNNHITPGLVSIQSQHINVSLGISGASLPKRQEQNDSIFQNLATQPCDSFSANEIPLVKLSTNRAQENSYLHAAQTKLPNWIKLDLPTDGNLKTLYSYQLSSTFLDGRQLKDRLGGYSNSLIDNNLYSTQFVSSQAKIKLGKEIVELPRYGKSAPITLAMSLCAGNGNGPNDIALIALPIESLSLIDELDFLKRLKQYGWHILPRSLMIVNNLQTPSQIYYNGINMTDYKISKGNMALQLEIKKRVAQNGFFNSTFSFDGTADVELSNISKILDNGFGDLDKVSLDGRSSVQLDLSIMGNLTQVKIESDKSSSYMDLGEVTKINKSKLLVNSLLQEDPFRSSLIGNFLELEKPNKVSMSLDVPLNTSQSGNFLEATSLQFRGKLKDGSMVIPDLNVQMHISQPRPDRAGDIQINGKGKQKSLDNLGKIFQKFADLPLEVNITIPSVSTDDVITVFKATIDIMGIRDTVLFNFSKGYTTWESQGIVFKKYRVKYNASLNIEDKTLEIAGYLHDGPQSLQKSLSEGAFRVSLDTYNKSIKRLDEAKKSEKNFLQKLSNAKRLYEQNKKKMKDAKTNQDVANENVMKIKNELEKWENSTKDSSETLTRLRERMNKLCNVKICDLVCETGTVCLTCYDYIEESVRGECFATCHKSFQRRVPPFIEIDVCARQECSYAYRRGLFSFIGKIIKFAATAVLSVFVPPPIAKGIVDGTAALIKTGNLGTAFCTFAKTAITGGILNTESRTIPEKLIKEGGKVVSNVINCGITPPKRDGRWNCYYRGVPCKKGVFKYEYDHTPYTCTRPCLKTVVTERIPYQCCDRDECAFEVPNARCVLGNTYCQRIRDEALSKVAESERNTAAIIQDYDKKRKQHFDEMIKLAKAKLNMKSTEQKLHIFEDFLEISKRAYNNSKRAREETEEMLGPIIRLNSSIKANKRPIKIRMIRFAITQKGEWTEQRLLPIDIDLELSGKSKGVLRTVLDFNNLERSEQSIQKEIVRKVFGNDIHIPLRRRRSVDTEQPNEDESISSLRKYAKLCSSLTNSLKILHEVFSSLINLVVAHLNNITKTETTPIVERSFSSLDIKLNKTLAEELGIEKETLKYDMTTEDNALIDKIEDVFNISSALNADQMKIESDYFYSKWYASMENIFNRTGRDCSGFYDCLKNTADVIFELFDDFYMNKTYRVFSILKSIDTQLEKFSPALEMSAIDALNISNYTLSLITKVSEEDVFCFQAPNITHGPPSMVELSLGQDLVLSCNATGYRLSFSWQHNGTDLQGHDSNVLLIKNVTRCHQGYYRCVVSNYVSTERSSPTFLIVKTPPKIIKNPVPYLDPKMGSTAYLECKGESSGLRSMNYSWFYQPVGSTKYTVLPNQTYPVMGIPNVISKNKGSYICTVSNAYGSTKSTSTFLEPLEYSLPVPALSLTFSMESIVNDIEKLQNRYPRVAEHLKSFLQGKVTSVAGSVMVDVVEPRVTSGRLHPKSDDITSLLVTEWQVQLKITSKISEKGNREDEIYVVQNASEHLQVTYKKLSNYINSEKRHFVVDNSKHNLLPQTFGVTKLVMECPKGQSYDQHFLSCVNCPSGSRSIVDSDALTKCQPCEIGTYQPNQGEVNCISCKGDLTTASEGCRRVKNCKVICGMGHFAEITDNHGKCKLCPENTYQPFTGQSACLPCPCRFVTNGTGKTSEKDCEPTNYIRDEISKSDAPNMVVIYVLLIIAGLCVIVWLIAWCSARLTGGSRENGSRGHDSSSRQEGSLEHGHVRSTGNNNSDLKKLGQRERLKQTDDRPSTSAKNYKENDNKPTHPKQLLDVTLLQDKQGGNVNMQPCRSSRTEMNEYELNSQVNGACENAGMRQEECVRLTGNKKADSTQTSKIETHDRPSTSAKNYKENDNKPTHPQQPLDVTLPQGKQGGNVNMQENQTTIPRNNSVTSKSCYRWDPNNR